jgi:5-(hydroxymethyl)furfural/furfural oxidase
LSERIERLSRPNRFNAALSAVGAVGMDVSASLRTLIIDTFVTEGVSLRDVLANDKATEDYVVRTLGTSWHPCGTCRMGARSDAQAVVDAEGAVLGISGLFVADASIMPRIPRTNTNLPTIMIAEKLSQSIPQTARERIG